MGEPAGTRDGFMVRNSFLQIALLVGKVALEPAKRVLVGVETSPECPNP